MYPGNSKTEQAIGGLGLCMVLINQSPPISVKSVRHFLLKYLIVVVGISVGICLNFSFVFSW